jgi:hypothetical protein
VLFLSPASQIPGCLSQMKPQPPSSTYVPTAYSLIILTLDTHILGYWQHN